ncbi:MAG: ketopantoate reductase [Rickettsiales bacterium]|jgi:ketopantoate reductase
MKPAQKFPPKQRITIVGTGQVASLVAGLLIKKNRELDKEIQLIKEKRELDFENKIGELESKKVEISILGKSDDSVSFQEFKKKGFTLHFANKLDFQLLDIKVTPDDFVTITANPDEIGGQDHVFIATKTYSHDQYLIDRIAALKKENPVLGLETTMILAQNGIPCWLPIESDDLNNPYLDSEMVRSIGEENIVGCVLNFACNNTITDKEIVCGVNTPLDNIGMPLGRPDHNQNMTLAMKDLHLMFLGTGIRTAVRDHGIKQDVMYKLQINVAINALTTLLSSNIEGLFTDDLCRKIVGKLSSEMNQLSKDMFGFDLRDFDSLEERLLPTSKHTTSTKKDFDEGKQVEFSIYKNVIELGKRFNKSGGQTLLIVSSIAEIFKKAINSRDQSGDVKEALKEVSQELSDLIQLVDISYNPGTPKRGSPLRSPTVLGMESVPFLNLTSLGVAGPSKSMSPNQSKTNSLKSKESKKETTPNF